MVLAAVLAGSGTLFAASREPSYVGLWRSAGQSCQASEQALTSYTRYSMRNETRACRIARVEANRPNWTLTLECKGVNDQPTFSIVEQLGMSEDANVLKVSWHSPDLASRGEQELHRCP